MQNNKQPLVTIIIPTMLYDNLLSLALKSTTKISYHNYEVIVVNNNPHKLNKYARIKNTYKQRKNFLFLASNTNLYFANAINLGVKHAKGKYIFASNDDITYEKQSFTNMVNKIESNPKICVVSPVILTSQTKQIDTYGGYVDIFGFCYKITDPNHNPSKIFSIGAGLYRKSCFTKLNGYDPRSILVWEDVDLSWRIHLSGQTTTTAYDAIVYHQTSATTKHLSSEFKTFHARKNRLRGLIKNYSLPLTILTVPITILLYLLVSTKESIAHRSAKPFLTTLRSILWNYLNIHDTLTHRRFIQQQVRKVSDISIISKMHIPFTK